jgi:hypothetical protein
MALAQAFLGTQEYSSCWAILSLLKSALCLDDTGAGNLIGDVVVRRTNEHESLRNRVAAPLKSITKCPVSADRGISVPA